ncbi:266_t:CDS:1, partial [Dentiscutata heterogama]
KCIIRAANENILKKKVLRKANNRKKKDNKRRTELHQNTITLSKIPRKLRKSLNQNSSNLDLDSINRDFEKINLSHQTNIP